MFNQFRLSASTIGPAQSRRTSTASSYADENGDPVRTPPSLSDSSTNSDLIASLSALNFQSLQISASQDNSPERGLSSLQSPGASIPASPTHIDAAELAIQVRLLQQQTSSSRTSPDRPLDPVAEEVTPTTRIDVMQEAYRQSEEIRERIYRNY